MDKSEKRIIALYALFFSVGVFLHLHPAFRPITTKITDVFLLLANAGVLFILLDRNPSRKLIIYIAFAMLFTFAAEVAGVKTGLVFGGYEYGETLWMQLFSVPLVIPLNWVMLVLGFTSLALLFKLPRWTVPWIAAAGAAGFDFIMEPVAIELNFWNWSGGAIPLQNYFAWFLIAFLLSLLARQIKLILLSPVLRAYVIIQCLFFGILNVAFHLL